MDSILAQLKDLHANADEEGRRQIQAELRDFQNSVDTDFDTVCRIGSGYLQMALVKVGRDLRIFELLVSNEKPLSLEYLSETTGADSSLLGHLLRAKAAFGLIKETGPGSFTANDVARTLANVHVAGAIEHGFEVHGKVALHLPSYLASRKYQAINSITDLPFHEAFNTTLTPFDWLRQNPEHMESMAHASGIQRAGSWHDYYPVEREVGNFMPTTESALLVDIGGGFGQQAIALKNKFPDLLGRYVVQDISETLDRAKPIPGIEFQVHDFFQPQTVKGAKFYYMRHIMHDWTDELCIKILKEIVPAMGPESRIVIDDIVLPNSNIPWQAAYMDLSMMFALGGIERTRAEFDNVLEKAGLQVVDFMTYDPKMSSVIFAAPK